MRFDLRLVRTGSGQIVDHSDRKHERFSAEDEVFNIVVEVAEERRAILSVFMLTKMGYEVRVFRCGCIVICPNGKIVYLIFKAGLYFMKVRLLDVAEVMPVNVYDNGTMDLVGNAPFMNLEEDPGEVPLAARGAMCDSACFRD